MIVEPACDIAALAQLLRSSTGLAAKADIGLVSRHLGIGGNGLVPVGDDCAAIPDADGHLLFAIEGFQNEFVAGDPWFAGWCGVMVNLSDIAAMGGRPIAVVDALWAAGEHQAQPVLEGLRAASERYGVPIVGGHTNLRTERGQLSVAVLGRAKKLLSSFAAAPGDRLLAAIDLRGRYRGPFANWEAATTTDGERLRGDLDLLPGIAEDGLAQAAKDISQGGVIGTAAMLAECSAVAIDIDVRAIPRPSEVPWERWLLTFPSFGFLIAARPDDVAAISERFAARGIACRDIGGVTSGSTVSITDGDAREVIWDHAAQRLLGCRPELVAP